MKKGNKAGVITGIIVMALGLATLLQVLDIFPQVNDWDRVVGLIVVGLVIMVFGGINRFTVVIGSFLIITGICSCLRQLNAFGVGRRAIDQASDDSCIQACSCE